MTELWYCVVLPIGFLFLIFGAFTKGQRVHIFKRANAQCEKCGANWNDGIMLECHHIVPLSEGGADCTDNGILLCRPDHANAHDDLAYDAKKRGDQKARRNNEWAAQEIRKRRKYRDGY